MDNEFLKDSGYKSRKFIFSIVCLVAGVVAGAVCPAAVMPEVAAVILGVCGIYVTGNVVNRVKGVATFVQPEPEQPGVAEPEKE